MHTQHFIPVDEFCTSHNIEISLISALQETGLIEMATIAKKPGIFRPASSRN